MNNYICINGKKAELTDEQLALLGIGINKLIKKPEHNKEYFYISDLGTIESDLWFNTKEDNYLYEIGNVYTTEAKALKALGKMLEKGSIINRQIENWLIENDDGWVADWSNNEQEKYRIFYNAAFKKYDITHDYIYNACGVSYMSENNVKKLIKILKEEK